MESIEDTIRRIVREEVQAAVIELKNEINPPNADLPEMLSVKQAAAYLGVSLTIMYEQLRRKDFPVIEIGRHYKIPRAEFLKWIKDNSRKMSRW